MPTPVAVVYITVVAMPRDGCLTVAIMSFTAAVAAVADAASAPARAAGTSASRRP